MGYVPYSCGSQRITTSGAISDSGKPILIAGYSVLSGATAAIPYFLDGTSTSTIRFRAQGQASVALVSSIPLPVMFPTGCYVSFDANTTEVAVFYILQSVTS